MMNILFFDIGGTLVDAPNLFELYNEFISQYIGIDLTKEIEESFMEYYQAEIFYTIEDMFKRVLKEISQRYDIKDCSEYAHQIYYEIFFNKLKVKKEAIEVLEESDYLEAFSPFEFGNNFGYFVKTKDEKTALIFDGEIIELEYLDIWHYGCCEDSALNILQYQDTIDFFAEKIDGWYHVEIMNRR